MERKRRFAVTETTALPAAAYRPEVTAEVYARLYDLAGAALRAGQAAVVDAVFQRADERAAIEAVAADPGVGFAGLWLEAPLAVLQQLSLIHI